jgi:hypothetical protein
MIRHTILFKLKSHVSKQEVEHVFSDIIDLAELLPGIISITGGTCYFHAEQNASAFSHGFSIDFEDRKALDAFKNNPATSPVKNRLNDIAVGGHQGIFGFDFGAGA